MRSLPGIQIQKREILFAVGISDLSLLGILLALILLTTTFLPATSHAQPIDVGVAFLTGSQEADGSWQSSQVRSVHVTSEALRTLQAVATAPAVRSAAVELLELKPVEDSGDRARRIAVLAAEGSSIDALVAQLLADVDPDGGWGLTPGFVADPLDSALALVAVAPQPAAGETVLSAALSSLLAAQQDTGGWPCVDTADADSEIFCTSHALLALTAYSGRFFLGPELAAAASFLHARRNADGSFGPAGVHQILHTAVAATALAAVPAFGSEVATVTAFLEGSQQLDGSWGGDPYVTALALRSLHVLAAVPYCGDGAINQPAEACDSLDLAGLSCEGIGLGAGTLACSPQCILDTSGCADPPVCGDDLRNQSFEVCDGTDLAAESCESLGFASGSLACAAACLSFDVSGCNADAACGDGVVNQPGELCDLSDLNGATCQSLGLGGGILACAPDCNLDTSRCDAASFEIDNKGREFIVGFLRNFDTTGTAALHLTSDVATTVTVQYPVNTPSFVQNVAVNPGQVTIVNLPRSAYSGWTTGQVRNNAVRAASDDEFVVYLVNRRSASSDAGMALPIDALGTSYFVMTFRGSFVFSGDRSQFLVVAPFGGTTVKITPTTTVRILGTTFPPGVPVQVTLDRGQGVRSEAVFSRTDLTGTVVEADRPVYVVGGNICTNVPSNVSFCDHLFEVGHPVRSWGTSALVMNLPQRAAGSVYRVVASVDGTDVTLDGVLQTTLNRGGLFEAGPLTGRHIFAASHPIFVTQFMTGDSSPGAIDGDPAMANMIPPEQYLEDYTFSTVGGGQFRSHFLTIMAPDSALETLLLDGVAMDPGAFSPVADSGFSSALLPLSEGSHATTSLEPHGITVEGLNAADSYIYPGGARLEFINEFCGDGTVNLESEECDSNDFEGATCASFGFPSGLLQCTVDCRIDTSQCSGFSTEDRDDDGFPATEDCDDLDPEVSPGMPEIPGNGVDDDCNPGTPDEVPEGALSCHLVSGKVLYTAIDVVSLEATIENDDELFSLTGVAGALVVRENGGPDLFEEERQLAPLPPGARLEQSFAFAAAGNAPGDYLAELTVTMAGEPAALCSTGFSIESSAATGTGLTGTLTLDPELVNAGESSNATYTVTNQGNAALFDLGLRVVLLDPESGEVVGELLTSASLDPAGGSFSDTQTFLTAGLESNKSYLAVLLATPDGSDVEETLASALLTVVNAPPDCTGAFSDPGDLWPPNHRFVEVAIGGVNDPDGDPTTLTVDGVLQDERTDDLGSGDTCPDAAGVGSSGAQVRAERSGRQDGRVYHLFFTAVDGRGGACQGEVMVCVPHDGRPGATCVDQGALFDSTACP